MTADETNRITVCNVIALRIRCIRKHTFANRASQAPKHLTLLTLFCSEGLSGNSHFIHVKILEEARSAEFIARILEAEGFALERGVADMPTAFVAQWGEGGPVIGILAEYDALPNIGNDPVPASKLRSHQGQDIQLPHIEHGKYPAR